MADSWLKSPWHVSHLACCVTQRVPPLRAEADGERYGRNNVGSTNGRQGGPGHRRRKKEAAHPMCRIKREATLVRRLRMLGRNEPAEGALVWLIPGARTGSTVRIRRGARAGRAEVERLGTKRYTVRVLCTLHRGPLPGSHGVHATLQQRARGSAVKGYRATMPEARRRGTKGH